MTLYRRLLQALTAPPWLLDVAIGAVGAILCLAMTGYFQIDMARPSLLGGDHMFYLTVAKSYINGHGFRFDSQLGFPSERDNLYFPNSDLTYRIGFWLAAHFTTSPFRAMHSVYIAGLLAMDGFSYWMLRRLKINPVLATLGALAAVLTHFLVWRSFAHDAIALYFTVPLALGLVLSIGPSSADTNLKRFLRDPFIILAVLVVGTSGIYYAFYTLMLTAFVAVAASLGQRRWFPLLAGVCAMAPILILVVFSATGLDLPLVMSGKISAPAREPFEQLFFGLNLPSLIYDFSPIPKVALALAHSQQVMPAAFTNEGVSEWPSLPLASILMASPLIVTLIYYRRGEKPESSSTYPGVIGLCAALIVFMILFGARGGLGYIFNVLVWPQIRADARLMPFLTTAAVVIACALSEWAWTSRSVFVRYSGPLVIGLALLASSHQAFGALKARQRGDLADPHKAALIQSVQTMLKAKNDAHLQKVLQLPVFNWPEAGGVNGYDPYLHQLPYIYDKAGRSTRWSYGSSDRQPGVALVNFSLSEPATILDRARGVGFDSILIAKSAYEPAQLDSLRSQTGARLAPACRLYEDDFYVLYAIKRAAHGASC